MNMHHAKFVLQLWMNKIARSFGYVPKPHFPQAGVGSGIIFFCRLPGENIAAVRMGFATRSAKVGRGYGISCGGWMNLTEMIMLPSGTLLNAADEAIREGVEEIPGLLKVIPAEVIRARLQHITSAAVYVPHDRYGNRFHHGTYFACEVTPAEVAALEALPTSDETAAPLSFRTVHGGGDDSKVVGLPRPFHHAHEVQACAELLRMYVSGKLVVLK
jgi:hypothetical protein